MVHKNVPKHLYPLGLPFSSLSSRLFLILTLRFFFRLFGEPSEWRTMSSPNMSTPGDGELDQVLKPLVEGALQENEERLRQVDRGLPPARW